MGLLAVLKRIGVLSLAKITTLSGVVHGIVMGFMYPAGIITDPGIREARPRGADLPVSTRRSQERHESHRSDLSRLWLAFANTPEKKEAIASTLVLPEYG
jgi:hypothetical protein